MANLKIEDLNDLLPNPPGGLSEKKTKIAEFNAKAKLKFAMLCDIAYGYRIHELFSVKDETPSSELTWQEFFCDLINKTSPNIARVYKEMQIVISNENSYPPVSLEKIFNKKIETGTFGVNILFSSSQKIARLGVLLNKSILV